MGGSLTGRGGSYREAQKCVSAVFHMVDGKQFVYSKRDIVDELDPGYVEYVVECNGLLEGKSIYLANHKVMILVNYIKWIEFRVENV
jgi:hypothetical protein